MTPSPSPKAPRYPPPTRLYKIVTGWAAHGNGWAIHAPTKKLALKEYYERCAFYEELSKRSVKYRR